MKKILHMLIIISLLLALPLSSAHADVAPPETVPGSNLVPGTESTQVRMAAETVTLTITEDPNEANGAVAKTEAIFTMRNLGSDAETMNVRFPLSFFSGGSDGFGNYPEIANITVRVDGKQTATRREMQPFTTSTSTFDQRDEIPWAVFEVTFPPNQDVLIEVAYTVQGYGYYPYETFKYILETGAGWNGTIGRAEVILRLPYEASEYNVDFGGQSGYGETAPGGVFNGNEVRWVFEDFEPTFENNLLFIVVTPSLWQKLLSEDANVTRNRNDGEAWGRLAKAYKDIILMPKGYLRTDPAGLEMFDLSRAAYETSLSLLPEDPLWHYGYAELLWSYYYFEIYFPGKADTQNMLPATLEHLQTALTLDPNLQLAKDLLLEIGFAVPGTVQQNEDESYTLLALTATPIPPTPWSGYATETALPSTPEPVATLQAESTPQVPPPSTPEPTAANPLCGSAAIFPLLFGLVFLTKRQR